MKILFQNYTNPITTEPRYMSHAMKMAGLESEVWDDQSVSVYDILDSYKPDVLVAHFRTISNAIVQYLKDENGPDLVLNVTGATAAQLDMTKDLAKDIKVPLLFSNGDVQRCEGLNIKGIYPAADVFLSYPPQEAKIPLGVVGVELEDSIAKACEDKDVYHLISIGEADNFDINANVMSLHELYSFYNKIILSGPCEVITSQLFFDACLFARDIEVLPSEGHQEQFDKFLSRVFSEPKDSDVGVFQEIQKQIQQRHTPFNRAERLLRCLKDDDSARLVKNLHNKVAMSPAF